MTSIYFDYGGANQVELTEGTVAPSESSRNVYTYKVGTDNSVCQNMGKPDRFWHLIMCGPISLTDLAKLRSLTESTTAINFRAPATSNADVTVKIISYDTKLGTSGLPSAVTTTRALYVDATLRESV